MSKKIEIIKDLRAEVFQLKEQIKSQCEYLQALKKQSDEYQKYWLNKQLSVIREVVKE